MIDLSKFAETLDYLIFEKNNSDKLDGKTLAKRLGVAAPTITRYLNAQRMPNVKNIVLLADYFNCTTDFLLGRESENYAAQFKPCPPFSEQFKILLKHYGYNCLSFANAANVHQSRAYDWKNGKKIPTLENVVKIADFLNCSVDFVLGREV